MMNPTICSAHAARQTWNIVLSKEGSTRIAVAKQSVLFVVGLKDTERELKALRDYQLWYRDHRDDTLESPR